MTFCCKRDNYLIFCILVPIHLFHQPDKLSDERLSTAQCSHEWWSWEGERIAVPRGQELVIEMRWVKLLSIIIQVNGYYLCMFCFSSSISSSLLSSSLLVSIVTLWKSYAPFFYVNHQHHHLNYHHWLLSARRYVYNSVT